VPLLLIGSDNHKIDIFVRLHSENDNSYKVRFNASYFKPKLLVFLKERVSIKDGIPGWDLPEFLK
jgi:hypothetical protein